MVVGVETSGKHHWERDTLFPTTVEVGLSTRVVTRDKDPSVVTPTTDLSGTTWDMEVCHGKFENFPLDVGDVGRRVVPLGPVCVRLFPFKVLCCELDWYTSLEIR